MRPTPEQIVAAVARMRRDLKFFPADDAAHKSIMILIERMVPTGAALEWLVLALVNHVGEWPGLMDVRGILCTRFKPLDGIEANTKLTGFSPDDIAGGNGVRIGSDRQLSAAKPVKEPPLTEEEIKWIHEFSAKLKAKKI